MADTHTPETRQDRITKEWVACAPRRRTRPKNTDSQRVARTTADDTPVEGCPFCPGHEDMLPSVLWELTSEDDRPWRTRAVPNKYAALKTDANPATEQSGLYRTRSSYGHQEVLITTPYHSEDLPRMSPTQVEAIVQTYSTRYKNLRESDKDLYPVLFHNHGAKAGASIPHPHSQIIAPDFPPPRIEREETAARTRYEETGRCPYCEMIGEELSADVRLVHTNDEFVVFVPFAARVPFELWVVPRNHEPEFGRLTERQQSLLATTLQDVVSRLDKQLDDPDYNFFVRTALEYGSESSYLHWTLRLQPRTTAQAGFELGTGIQINPSIPERDAAVLREA